jgi:hypothetical protein
VAQREVTAGADGRVIINAELLHLAGTIDIKADPDSERAQLVISTEGEAGASVDAIDGVEPEWRDGRLSISITGNEGTRAGGPVTITGTVPPGCTLEVATTSAAISTNGVAEVDARTDSGNVSANDAEYLKARLKVGDLSVGEATTVDARTKGSGGIDIKHALHINARSEDGSISVEHSDGDTWLHTQGGEIDIKNFENGTVHAGTTTGPININASGGGAIHANSEIGPITVTADTAETAAALRVDATSRGGVTAPAGSLRDGPELPATSGTPLSHGTRAPKLGAGRATDTKGPCSLTAEYDVRRGQPGRALSGGGGRRRRGRGRSRDRPNGRTA